MDPPVPSISESEWKIMKLLWAKSPQPAYDLIAVLAKTEDWHPNTIKTLLSRLHKKRALGIKKYKNLYRYSPLVFEEACVHAESESFLHLMLVSALAAATTLPSGEAARIQFKRDREWTRITGEPAFTASEFASLGVYSQYGIFCTMHS